MQRGSGVKVKVGIAPLWKSLWWGGRGTDNHHFLWDNFSALLHFSKCGFSFTFIHMWRHFLCWMWFCHWFLLCLKQTKECIWWALRLITSLSLFLFVCLCCRAVCFGLSVSLIQNFGSRHTLSACFAIFLNRSRFCEFVPPSRLEGEAKEARTGGYYARGHYFCHRNHLRWNHLSLLAVIRILLLKWIHNT